MAAPENLAAIGLDGGRILEIARHDPQRNVPQYPGWTLADLVTHVARVHARTLAICQTLPRSSIPRPSPPRGTEVFDWYEETLEAMIDALANADPEAEVWTFIPDKRVRAWERRMVIETGIHRWDAQQAVEDPGPLLSIVAAHGLDEFSEQWMPRLGDLPTLEVTAIDLGRSWRYGSAGPTMSVSGTASDIFLRLMSRPGVELPEPWAAAIDALEPPAE